MIKEYIGEADNLLLATENAKEGLISLAGLKANDEDNIQIEVVSDYKRKTLGLFGGSLAKVRAYIELPDPAPKKDKKVQNKKAPVVKGSDNQKVVKKESAKEEVQSKTPENLKDYTEFSEDSNAFKSAKYIISVLSAMGCENITVKAAESDNSVYLQLDGDKLGVVIGRRGETLDALQYLTSLSAHKEGGFLKVTLNIGNYREKRERTLTALASKVAAQVLSTGRNRTLEPMNPYERRIIHTAIQEIPGVESNSIGEGDNRRIVVSAIGSDKKGGKPRNNKVGNRKVSNTVAAPAREPKTDSTSVPLYGRLN